MKDQIKVLNAGSFIKIVGSGTVGMKITFMINGKRKTFTSKGESKAIARTNLYNKLSGDMKAALVMSDYKN